VAPAREANSTSGFQLETQFRSDRTMQIAVEIGLPRRLAGVGQA